DGSSTTSTTRTDPATARTPTALQSDRSTATARRSIRTCTARARCSRPERTTPTPRASRFCVPNRIATRIDALIEMAGSGAGRREARSGRSHLLGVAGDHAVPLRWDAVVEEPAAPSEIAVRDLVTGDGVRDLVEVRARLLDLAGLERLQRGVVGGEH